MGDESVSEALQRLAVLEGDRSAIESQWQAVENYILPYRGKFFTAEPSESGVDWNKRHVFDATAVHACQSLAASLHAALVPASLRWFSMGWRDPRMRDNRDWAAWLDEVSEIMYQEVRKSNFHTEVGEFFQEMPGFGTAALMLEERADSKGRFAGLQFTAIPIKEVFFEMDFDRGVRTLFRVLRLTPGQIISRFGADSLPDGVREKMLSPGAASTRFDVVFHVWRRDGVDEYEGKGRELPVHLRPFGYRYILRDCGALLGEEGGYHETPAFVVRWGRNASSQWGYSPALVALGDVLTLNHLVEMILDAGEKAIDPPMVTTERGLLTALDLRPRGLNVVRSKDDLAPLITGARFDVGQLRVEDLRKAIKAHFHMDQLELKDNPYMTATEVTVRYELMQRHLSPTVGHVEEELFDLMLTRVFHILWRNKRLPKLPKAEVEGADSNIDILYTGPLSRAQRADAVMAVDRYMQVAVALSQVNPEALDNLDVDAALDVYREYMAVPARVQASRENIEALRRDRKQQQQQAQQLAMTQAAGQAAEATGKGAQALEEARQQ